MNSNPALRLNTAENGADAKARRIESNVRVRVKWFSFTKNYGFAILENGQDIYIPHYAVEEAVEGSDVSRLDPETIMIVDIEHKIDKTLIKRILSTDTTAAIAPARRPEIVTGPTQQRDGQIKWYSVEKGYGFITLQDGADVFLRKSAVKNSGLDPLILQTGIAVNAEIYPTERGVQAKTIKIR